MVSKSPHCLCTRQGWILAAVALSLTAAGCVQRRMTIRSEPPGALVYVDNVEIGVTPISTNFLYYGTREIRLVKDGYETMTVLQPVPAPWYQIPPLDFFSENVVPGDIRDRRTFLYRLVPQRMVPGQELLGRAQELRGRATAAGATLTAPAGSFPAGPTPQQEGVREVLPPPMPLPQNAPPATAIPAVPPTAPSDLAPGGRMPYSLPPAGPTR